MRVGFGGDLMIRLLVVLRDAIDKDNTWIQHSRIATLLDIWRLQDGSPIGGNEGHHLSE
jgi:hypothetical protein